MARQVSEIQSLNFHQILGAPLLALVQGQTQAAQATAEFIERVGFLPGKTENGNGIGQLRMVTFSYEKPGPDGTPQKYTVSIPVLSLVTIPAIQIKSATFDYNIKVTDIQTSDNKNLITSQGSAPGDWLSSGRTEFRATMGKMQSDSSSGQQQMDMQMHVTIKVEQAEVTVGMSKLFHLLDQAISGGKDTGNENI